MLRADEINEAQHRVVYCKNKLLYIVLSILDIDYKLFRRIFEFDIYYVVGGLYFVCFECAFITLHYIINYL